MLIDSCTCMREGEREGAGGGGGGGGGREIQSIVHDHTKLLLIRTALSCLTFPAISSTIRSFCASTTSLVCAPFILPPESPENDFTDGSLANERETKSINTTTCTFNTQYRVLDYTSSSLTNGIGSSHTHTANKQPFSGPCFADSAQTMTCSLIGTGSSNSRVDKIPKRLLN